MRDFEKRLRALEQTRDAANAPPIMTLPDFYKAMHDPEHPSHQVIRASLARFYGDLRAAEKQHGA